MPSSWYTVPNFHYDNKCDRGLFCSKPCYSRYKPDFTGSSCIKIDKCYPSYCPQAEVMRVYTGLRKDKPYKFLDFDIKKKLKYFSNIPSEREDMLKDYYLKKTDFMNLCDDKMGTYKTMALSICSAAEMLENDQTNPLTKGIKKSDINKLASACKQAFCNSKTNYPFCSRLKTGDDGDDSMIVRKIIKLIIYIIIFLIIITFSIKAFLKYE